MIAPHFYFLISISEWLLPIFQKFRLYLCLSNSKIYAKNKNKTPSTTLVISTINILIITGQCHARHPEEKCITMHEKYVVSTINVLLVTKCMASWRKTYYNAWEICSINYKRVACNKMHGILKKDVLSCMRNMCTRIVVGYWIESCNKIIIIGIKKASDVLDEQSQLFVFCV